MTRFALLALLVARVALAATEPNAFDFSLVSLDGKNAPLSVYKGKVLLVTVIADKSEYSDQLKKLDDLYKAQQAVGLMVLGVPTPDFGGESLAAKTGVDKIYLEQLKLSFPVFAPTEVREKKRSFLFDYFANHAEPHVDGQVHWLFTKLLVNREGKLVAKFDSNVEPDAPQLLAAIEKTLANQSLQPKKEDEKKKSKPDDDRDSDR